MPDPEGTPPAGTAWRRSAKALVADPDDRLLLLHMHDPVDAGLGDWWELPGGGVEPGETPEEAVARELAEATGLLVPATSVGPALWTRRATFRWLGRRRWQEETVHVVRVGDTSPAAPSAAPALTDEEEGSVLGMGWRSLDEIARSGDACYPRRLVDLAPRVLAGETVEEGFERWS